MNNPRRASSPRRLVRGVAAIALAVAISVWLFSGESHVPNAGTVESYAADTLVVVLVVVGARGVRRALRDRRS
jgi:hypothetical protein